METALTHANTANDEAQRNIAQYTQQIVELQKVLEEEQRSREQFRTQFLESEKKLAAAKAEKEDLTTKLLQVCFYFLISASKLIQLINPN